MELQILVNHYKESGEIVQRFLRSLAAQRNVAFEVIICSDGGDVHLTEEMLSGYPFPITYAYLTHSGVCHTRNVMMDKATADYLMFCDIDDCFTDSSGLEALLNAAKEYDADVVGSPYKCERKTDDGFEYVDIERDILRVHGKIIKRSYLLENSIRFPDEMEISGDMMFLWLCYALTDRTVWIEKNFYTWKWNPGSVTRWKPLHDIRTYDRTLRCYTLLAEDLDKRNATKLKKNLVATTFGMMYVDSTNPRWSAAPREYVESAEKAIKEYLQKYYSYYLTIDEAYRRDKYFLMLRYKHAEKLSGPFEGIKAWAESRLGPASDVLIIGCGTVGSNLSRELSALKPHLYDKYKGIDTRQPGKKYALAFICVDTPSTDESLCDISEVRNAILENDADLYVIKSTVLPGTTEKLSAETGKNIVFSPEYYGGTQHCNNYTFDFTILGGRKEDCRKVIQLLQKVYDGRHRFRITDSKTAELVKYMENSYLAMKVSFCSQFFEIAEKLGISYEELRELFVLDPRVEPSHTFIYRDKPYWDSHCLNKDVPAIADALDAPLLKSVIKYNESKKRR